MANTREQRSLARENKAIETALADDERILNEYRRLAKLYNNAPVKQQSLSRKLIARAAFMAITLDDLERDINSEGTTEEYRNGENQYGVKRSAKVDVYNTMVKNYVAVMKQLDDMLRVEELEVEDVFDTL